jgi:hypothetical protein
LIVFGFLEVRPVLSGGETQIRENAKKTEVYLTHAPMEHSLENEWLARNGSWKNEPTPA